MLAGSNDMPWPPPYFVVTGIPRPEAFERSQPMATHRSLKTVWLVLLVITVAQSAGAQTAAEKAKAATEQTSAAVKASPDLVTALSKEIGSTPDQAAGAAGSLFAVAKGRLKPNEFSQVAKAVPGMDALLAAAPSAGGTASALSQAAGAAGAAGGLASAASAFSKLGLKPDLVAKAVPVLTSFVTKSGGADVGKLLAGVLK
jgi:hypothetical protein